jgi:hypothetical protein
MKPARHEASEKERALRAVYKRLEAGEKKKDEARSEEATEMRTQQECILSGGVYLRHRLKRQQLSFLSNLLYHKNKWRASSAFGRAGVQETTSPALCSHLVLAKTSTFA